LIIETPVAYTPPAADGKHSQSPRLRLVQLTESAERHGPRQALKLGDTVVTHAELDAASARVTGLAPAACTGEHVGVMLPNVPQFAMADFGIPAHTACARTGF